MNTLALSCAARTASVILNDPSAPQCVHAAVTALGALAGVPRGAYYPEDSGRWVAAYPEWLGWAREVVASIETVRVTADPMHAARRLALRSALLYADSIDPSALLGLVAALEVTS